MRHQPQPRDRLQQTIHNIADHKCYSFKFVFHHGKIPLDIIDTIIIDNNQQYIIMQTLWYVAKMRVFLQFGISKQSKDSKNIVTPTT